MTCTGVVDLLSRLQRVLAKSLGLDSVLLVEGESSPTMNFPSSMKDHFVVKTGTLYDTPVANMAGAFVSQGEFIFFADLNAPTTQQAEKTKSQEISCPR